MWYNRLIVTSTRRLSAVTIALAVLCIPPAEAQNSRRAPNGGTRLAFAIPAGAPAGGGRLNQLFDAARLRANTLSNAVVAAPRFSERAPAPPADRNDIRPTAARLHQELVVPVPRETPIYRLTFKLLLTQPMKTDRWDELIDKYARTYRLDARFLKSIMAAESEFDPNAVSPSGARGLMQVMPATAEGMGVPARKLHDPEYGIKAGAAYLQHLFKTAWRIFHLQGVRYTDAPHWVMQRVVAAYHAGPKFLTRNRWFGSTRAYVRKVVLFYHSKVTDLRRPTGVSLEFPSFSETIAPGGSLH